MDTPGRSAGFPSVSPLAKACTEVARWASDRASAVASVWSLTGAPQAKRLAGNFWEPFPTRFFTRAASVARSTPAPPAPDMAAVPTSASWVAGFQPWTTASEADSADDRRSLNRRSPEPQVTSGGEPVATGRL